MNISSVFSAVVGSFSAIVWFKFSFNLIWKVHSFVKYMAELIPNVLYDTRCVCGVEEEKKAIGIEINAIKMLIGDGKYEDALHRANKIIEIIKHSPADVLVEFSDVFLLKSRILFCHYDNVYSSLKQLNEYLGIHLDKDDRRYVYSCSLFEKLRYSCGFDQKIIKEAKLWIICCNKFYRFT